MLEREPTPRRAAPYIVGIGASAGGLEALERLLVSIPADIGAAFVVVQHLSPDFRSMMDELLARRTRLSVRRVEDGMEVDAGTIYLIPPGKEMILAGGTFRLTDTEPKRELALPIDVFFRSLAQEAGRRAVAVVLSGTGTDGTRGIREIDEDGGHVFVQDPETAGFDGMPASALDTGVAGGAMSPEAIAGAIRQHVARGPPARGDPATADSAHARVLALLRDQFGIDFGYYKPSTVTRRIERRLGLQTDDGIDAYVTRLAGDPDELEALYRDLLIGVTEFFRDDDAYARLEREVPALVERAAPGEELRVWVAGCATGEEAYSLAILLHEALERREVSLDVKLFATDVHAASLEIASAGVYPESCLARVSPRRRGRYFTRRGHDSFRVASEIRQMVVFASHDVLADAPFTRLDLVSCRNLLIYLQPLAQRKALSLFHFGLRQNGLLFLGPSETAASVADEFDVVHERSKLYRKRREARSPVSVRLPEPRPPARQAQAAAHADTADLLGTYDALLDEYMPPSLLVNERRELVHAFGGASELLAVRDGRPTLDVLDMVPLELRVPLTGALQRARKGGGKIVLTGVEVGGDRGGHTLTVKPVRDRRACFAHMLVTLEPMEPAAAPAPANVHELELGGVSRDHLRAVDDELRHTRESLQATIEELETSNEELQATNEELVASNEELQSTNEELQSVNEELYTVNAEFQKKIQELTELTNDIDNLLSSTDVGTVFLDRDLRIRRFTPRIADAFSLLDRDVGRPIADFTHSIDHDTLLEDIRGVIDTGQPFEAEVRDRSGHWLFLRILPYHAPSGIDGAVLTLIDIGALKRAEDALFRERYLLDSLMNTLPDLVYFADADARFVRVNGAFADRLGLAHAAEAVGLTHADLRQGGEAAHTAAADREVLAEDAPRVNELEPVTDREGKPLWFLTTRMPLHDEAGRVVGVFGVSRDITQQKRAEDQARQAVTRRDEFLAVLSHELRNPLGAITNAARLLARKSGSERAVTIIERQVRQMARLLDELLDVSRVTQNKIELELDVFDLRQIATDAVQTVKAHADEAGVAVEVSLANQELPVSGDSVRLQQVAVNLLHNAIKYNRSGGRARLEMEPGYDGLVIRVFDDGVGMDRETLDWVFEPFVQSDATLSRSDAGMGLGLTLVRSLVELHGGRVWGHSAGVGQGSEFVVTLPRAATPAPRAAAPARAEPIRPGGWRVLLVEDSPDHRDTLRQLLELEGFDVDTARDGLGGVRSILKHSPDIAIVDIGLPEIDGLELARRVREEMTDAPWLVALTGYGSERDRQAVDGAGFDAHVVKPVDPDELARTLGRLTS